MKICKLLCLLVKKTERLPHSIRPPTDILLGEKLYEHEGIPKVVHDVVEVLFYFVCSRV